MCVFLLFPAALMHSLFKQYFHCLSLLSTIKNAQFFMEQLV